MNIFKNKAAYAGTANARTEFKIPIAIAARLMNRRYGNITRASKVVSASFSGEE
jgi:hypothetical protein